MKSVEKIICNEVENHTYQKIANSVSSPVLEQVNVITEVIDLSQDLVANEIFLQMYGLSPY